MNSPRYILNVILLQIIQGTTKAQSKKTSTEVSSSTEEPSLLDSVHGYQTIVGESKPNMGKTEITANKEDGVPSAKKKKVKKNIKGNPVIVSTSIFAEFESFLKILQHFLVFLP